eukprot:m.3116 g.3116  ORF g.3116 m.3116 type:complete len:233 (+) comp3231_c0_seq1:102-800(+)
MSSQPLSKETQELLASMMDKSKLTAFQKRQLQGAVKNGPKSLPSSVHPSTSNTQRSGVNSKHSKGAGGGRKKKKVAKVDQIQKRKNLDQILDETHHYTRPQYTSKQGHNRTLLREELGDMMSYGSEVVEKKRAIREKHAQKKQLQTTSPQTSTQQQQTMGSKKKSSEIDLFDIIVAEIDERQAHLDELQKHPHSTQQVNELRTEIAQRIKQLDTIDQRRTRQRISSKKTTKE